MSKSASVVENYEKIHKASVMEANEILFKNLSKLIENRRNVAINMLSAPDEQSYKTLKDVFDYTQDNIKKLLLI